MNYNSVPFKSLCYPVPSPITSLVCAMALVKSMKKVAKKVMKKAMKKVVKKTMKKAMKVGRKSSVFRGTREKTVGGLKKENLTKNKAVSTCSSFI